MSNKQYGDLENDSKEALSIILQALCASGDLEAIKENLTSKTAKEHGDIHYCSSLAFELLMHKEHINVIEYLIFDYKMERTSGLDKMLDSYNYPDGIADKVKNMFKIREVNELSDELHVNVEASKKNKI
jgi:hypothetical protein